MEDKPQIKFQASPKIKMAENKKYLRHSIQACSFDQKIIFLVKCFVGLLEGLNQSEF